MNESPQAWRESFVALVHDGGDDPPLVPASLALSRWLQRGDVWPGVRERLAELEEALRPRVAEASHEQAAVAILSGLAEAGFTASPDEAPGVAGSFVDRLLQTGRGLPITAAVVALHLAARLDVELHGIGFPGHFLVGWGLDTATPAVHDPFGGGQPLSFVDLAVLYRRATGKRVTSQAPWLRACLQPATTRNILSRMLRNLQRHYTLRGAHDRVAEVLGLLALMHPEIDQLRSLQGRIHRRLESLN